MDTISSPWLYTIIFGAVAGWLAGLLVGRNSFGLLGNIAVGIVGAYIGTYVLGALGISLGKSFIGQLFTAAAGAAVLTLAINMVRKML